MKKLLDKISGKVKKGTIKKAARIPVFYATDENYLPFAAISISSVLKNCDKNDKYDFYILTENIPQEKKKYLKSFESENVKVRFVSVRNKIKGLITDLEKSLRDYYTVSIFYRLFIPSLFPLMKKAIYLDSDTIIRGNLRELYDTDIGDNILAACRDEAVSNCPEFIDYVENAVGVPGEKYFNSGVLVMNLAKMREERIEQKFVDLVKRYNFLTVAPDQDYLNFLSLDKVRYLDKVWDKMPCADDIDEEKIKLIHYNMCDKPWHYDGILYEKYFWIYAEEMPFYDELVLRKKNYSEEEKKRDMASKIALVQKAKSIINEEKTFKKIMDKSKDEAERDFCGFDTFPRMQEALK